MLRFAEHQFNGGVAAPGGDTISDHMASIERQRKAAGKAPIAKPVPRFPRDMMYLWEHWLSIHRNRTTNGFSPSGATHLDVFAWQSNYGIRLAPWECDLINALSNLWAKAHIEAQSGPPPLSK